MRTYLQHRNGADGKPYLPWQKAFLTAILCLTVLLLAAEKHKSTYLAPIGIGLALFSCHLFGVVWTGCGMNPARALGPSVVASSFVSGFKGEKEVRTGAQHQL